jgi:hypothetical protein
VSYCTKKVEHTSDGYCANIQYGKYDLCQRHLIESLESEIKEANKVIEDFILTEEHEPKCRGNFLGEEDHCTCMDLNYFNKDSNLERAREHIKTFAR